MSTTGTTNSGGGGGGGGGPCGACKFLRRKCVSGCVFAPYFDSEQGAAHFAAVHKVFGASNVSKLLLHIPAHKRPDAVVTICYEAQARLRDPVYGCVAHIFALQQQVVNLQAELSYLQAHLATLELPSPPPPPVPRSASAAPSSVPPPPQQPFSIPDLSTVGALSTIFDVSSLLDPLAQQPLWPLHMQQQQQQHQQQQQQEQQQQQQELQLPDENTTRGSSDGGELQALVDRHRAFAGATPGGGGQPPALSK